jgi:hypothetical protein
MGSDQGAVVAESSRDLEANISRDFRSTSILCLGYHFPNKFRLNAYFTAAGHFLVCTFAEGPGK